MFDAVMPFTVRFLEATVSDAALLLTEAHVFVKTARYWLPLIDTVGFVRLRVALVAPPTFVKPEPESTCHCTVGAGEPLAAALKPAFDPYVIDCALGCVVTAGAVQAGPTVSVPPPVEESPVAAGLLARTVNGVAAAGVAAVVVIVNVDVFEVSPAAKLTVLGLKDALAPVGSDETTLRSALNAVPVEPFLVTVTL